MAGGESVILDTCALLWLAQGGGALSELALQRIDAAAVVYVSAISGFEIGIKVQKGKLVLPALTTTRVHFPCAMRPSIAQGA